jgi:hypothetical protein
MKKRIEILRSDLQPGDVTITANPGNNYIEVERDVFDPPKPGTIGTATVRGVKGVRGVWASLFDGEPYFVILEADKAGTGSLSSTANLVTDFVPEPGKPDLTHAQFVNTVNAVVDDNNIDVGDAALGRIIHFTADRLGLR